MTRTPTPWRGSIRARAQALEQGSLRPAANMRSAIAGPAPPDFRRCPTAVAQQPRTIRLRDQSAQRDPVRVELGIRRNRRLATAAQARSERALRVHHLAVAGSSSACKNETVRESLCRHSMPITPWVTAGRQIFRIESRCDARFQPQANQTRARKNDGVHACRRLSRCRP